MRNFQQTRVFRGMSCVENLLAAGPPERIQSDPRVVDAYLGAQ